MSADRLREAARVLRERAEAATPNPTLDRYKHGGGRAYAITDTERTLVADYYQEGNREFYATMHPGVGLALADWLEETCCAYHCDGDGRCWPYCSACEDSTEDHECPDRVVCTHSLSMQRALAIADLILGAES